MIIEKIHLNAFEICKRLLRQRRYPFLLDSCGLSRYSFAGADPFLVIRGSGDKSEIQEDSIVTVTNDNVFGALSSVMNGFKAAAHPTYFPFQGGAVGYFGYDLKNQLENLPYKKRVEPLIPDSIFCVYDAIFIYDHKKKEAWVAASGLPERDSSMRRLLARKRIMELSSLLSASENRDAPVSDAAAASDIKSNFTVADYLKAIARIKQHISSGEIYQANLSQRFTARFDGPPLRLYKNLRRVNPVRFGAFLDYGDFQIISNSPERLLKISNGMAETCPIKGTRPRGRNSEEDSCLIKDLKASPKENAEHIMIVDLERNDLGRICEFDSINVRPLKKIETYPTLHHMASTVHGRIKDNLGPVECLKAIFPGGSVTGAPKIMAMKIIDALEPVPRGVYTGAIGYIDFSGSMDMSMAIRTAVIKDRQLFLNVGGGIVTDSEPEKEYEETLIKAGAFFKAMGVKR